MKTRAFSVLALLVCLALLVPFAPAHGATQDPQPADLGRPGGPVPGVESSDPKQVPEGPWYVREGALPSAELSALAPRTTGGPDQFGYTWNDTEPFAWIDATVGNSSDLEGDDMYSGPVDIGFDFKFYENTYSQLFFSTNGLVTFGGGAREYYNRMLPNAALPNNLIAPFWDDLCIGYGYNQGAVYTLQGGSAPDRYFVVEWAGVSRLGSYDLLTFEVILHESGDIVLQYLDITGYLTSATVGIEDDVGVEGLTYLYNSTGLANGLAVRFYRPGPEARVKVWPLHHGSFTHPSKATAFEVPVTNTGELGADTYNLFTSPLWPVSLHEADGVTPLTDTDGDSVVDTGPVGEGATVPFVARVETPGWAVVGDDHTAAITVRSSLDPSKSKTASLRTAVPAPFAQVFRDDADGAMSLALIQPGGQVIKRATPDWTNGSYPAIAETAGGFAHFWTQGRTEGDATVSEIQYTLWNHYGKITRGAGKLTDHHGAVVSIYDWDPAVAVAPNGHIGVSWYRYVRDPSTSQSNYNIYFAVLDATGNLVHGPANVTNNTIWGSYGDYGWPQIYNARIAATGDNRFVLAWQRYTNWAAGSVADVYYAIRDTNGAEVVSVTKLTSDWPGYDQGYYDAAVTQVGADRALLAWSQDSDDNIYYSVRNSAGVESKPVTNVSSSTGWSPDAVELSNGNVLLAWSSWQSDGYRTAYAVLNAAYDRIAGPVILGNEAAPTGDDFVSVTADDAGHGILTWMDSDYTHRLNLYYALVGSYGELLTEPMIFYTGQAGSPRVETSYIGYGNTSYSWTPLADVDGDVAFASSLAGAPPGENAILRIEAANYGLTTATNFELVVTLDPELTYVSDNSGVTPTPSGNDQIWSLPDLAFFDSLDFQLTVQVPSGADYGTRYPVTLTFNSDGPEGDPSNNTASAEVMVAHRLFLPLVMRGY